MPSAVLFDFSGTLFRLEEDDSWFAGLELIDDDGRRVVAPHLRRARVKALLDVARELVVLGGGGPLRLHEGALGEQFGGLGHAALHHAHRGVAERVDQVDQFVVVVAAGDDGVELDAGEARASRGVDGTTAAC